MCDGGMVIWFRGNCPVGVVSLMFLYVTFCQRSRFSNMGIAMVEGSEIRIVR